MKKKAPFMAMLLVAAFTLVLAACSSDDPTATSAPSSAPVVSDDGATGDATTPVSGGVLTWVTSRDNQSGWDPHGITRIRSLAAQAASMWTNSLVKYQTGADVPGTDATVVPDLAESWDISADGLTYTFTLRQGVKFHDKAPANGRELTSADVKYSADRLLENKAHNFGWFFTAVKSVNVVDKYTVNFKLSQPDGALLAHLAEGMINIMPEGVAGPPTAETWPLTDEFKAPDQIIGTGPFMFVKHELDSRLTTAKNPSYFREGVPYLDGWEYVVVPDTAAAAAALAAGQVDAGALGSGTQESFLANNSDFTIWHEIPVATMATVQLRADKPPFDDVRVRRALWMAIDQQAIVDTRWSGSEAAQSFGSILVNAFPNEFLGHDELGDAAQYWDYNPEGAKALLAEAGYPNGFKIEFQASQCCVNDYFPDLVVDFWSKIGLDATANIVPHAVHIRTSNRGIYDYAAHSRVAIANFQDVLRSFEPGSVANVAHVDDPELVRLASEMQNTVDAAGRLALAHEAQRYLASAAYVMRIPMGNSVTASRPGVHDFRPHKGFHSLGRDMEIVWMDQ